MASFTIDLYFSFFSDLISSNDSVMLIKERMSESVFSELPKVDWHLLSDPKVDANLLSEVPKIPIRTSVP